MSINQRYDFVFLFDVKDGNPNGDPDAGNLPRIDAETGMGLVTDVCLKRKVRNFVQMTESEVPANKIFIREKAVLNDMIDESREQPGALEAKGKGDQIAMARKWMCANYYDVRTFGAVMTTGKNAGQVRGPVQLTFSRSIDPVVAAEHCITRMAVTKAEDADNERTMGRKFTIPYGLYRCHGFVSAHLAKQTGFGDDDLSLLWRALINMFDHDRSASRGEMTARGLYVFKHETELGNAPARKLFDLITIENLQTDSAPRDFSDYRVDVNAEGVPLGVSLDIKLD